MLQLFLSRYFLEMFSRFYRILGDINRGREVLEVMIERFLIRSGDIAGHNGTIRRSPVCRIIKQVFLLGIVFVT